jgi:DNA-binding NarL/FixJ family response regulator
MMQQLETADLRQALDVLVSFVDNGDRECLAAIRPHLERLYLQTFKAEGSRAAWGAPCRLTTREREVLQWLACGKTDRDIGCILGISPRTVQKHLQRMYEKLGVETRTAAVTRALRVAA